MIVFNGKSAEEVGLLVAPFSLTSTAEHKFEVINIPGKTEPIISKADCYEPVEIKVECDLLDGSRIEEVHAWLNGKGVLVDDRDPEKYRIAEVLDKIKETAVNDDILEIEITFTCSAFRYATNPAVVDFTKGFTEIINKGTMYSEPTITFDVIPAEAPMLMGDVNFDGVVDASDASLVSAEYNRILKGEELTFTTEQNAAADMNGNGEIDLQDVTLILNAYAQNQTDHSYSAVAEKYVNINVNGEELIVGLPSAAVRSGYPVTIDCSVPLIYYTTSDGKKVNIMQYSKGNFPLLKIGTNYVKYSGDITNAKITVNERWK